METDEIKKIEDIFQCNIEAMSEKFERTVTHQMGVLSEDFQHKLDIVIEGHQMLNEKIDRLDGRVDRFEGRMDGLEGKMVRLEAKVDAVADDLAAHRADTEAHHGIYRVRESE